MSHYLALFPRRQRLVVDLDDLEPRRPQTLARVFEFLGVDPGFAHPEFRVVKHRTAEKRRLSRSGLALEAALQSRRMEWLPANLWRAVIRLASYHFSAPLDRVCLTDAVQRELRSRLRADLELFESLTAHPVRQWLD